MACAGVSRSILFLSLLLALGLLSSCFDKKLTYQFDLSAGKNFQSGEFAVFWQDLEVKDEAQAQQFYKSRFEYFESHFVDSYDPYFGVKAVPEWCQKKLYFHPEAIADHEGFWSYAHFPQDALRNIGCKEQAALTVFIIRYCREQNLVKSFWIRAGQGDDLSIIPSGFTCQGLMSYKL